MADILNSDSFIDLKFNGFQLLNESIGNNQSSIGKFLRVIRELYSAQDLYVKALIKVNTNMSQLIKEKSDCLFPICEVFSTTLCIYTNIQKEFAAAVFHTIRNLNTSNDQLSNTSKNVFSQKETSVIDDFKSALATMEKSKLKFSVLNSTNPNSKECEKSKLVYIESVKKHNKLRTQCMAVFTSGFNSCQTVQLEYIDVMRRCIKGFGNAFAKLVFDMKESVDALKIFYRSNTKETIFENWVVSNKTNDSDPNAVFPEVTIDLPEFNNSNNNEVLLDLSEHGVDNGFSNSPKGLRKIFHPRKMSHTHQPSPSTAGQLNILDQDVPDFGSSPQKRPQQNQQQHRASVSGSSKSSSKRRWSAFPPLKKFQSASNLLTVTEKPVPVQENETWQSKSNLHEDIAVDAEGFIIRDDRDVGITKKSPLSSSSFNSDSSAENRLAKINVCIRPVSGSCRRSKVGATKSELEHAANQLPLPLAPRPKSHHTQLHRLPPPAPSPLLKQVSKRTSQLRRSSRPVSYIGREKFYRRSMSVSELQSFAQPIEGSSPTGTTFASVGDDQSLSSSNDAGNSIPLACAFTELVSSEDLLLKPLCVSGQLTLALPMTSRALLQRQEEGDFGLLSDVKLLLCDEGSLLAAVRPTAALEKMISVRKMDLDSYEIEMTKEAMKEFVSKPEPPNGAPNRISIPLIDYTSSIKSKIEDLFCCNSNWHSSDNGSNIRFVFSLSGAWTEYHSPIIVNIKLVTEGHIDKVVYGHSTEPLRRMNDQFWTVSTLKPNMDSSTGDQSDPVTVSIVSKNLNRIRIRLDYEFLLEHCSVVNPIVQLIDCDPDSEYRFKMVLVHNRTVSIGNLTQHFDYNIR